MSYFYKNYSFFIYIWKMFTQMRTSYPRAFWIFSIFIHKYSFKNNDQCLCGINRSPFGHLTKAVCSYKGITSRLPCPCSHEVVLVSIIIFCLSVKKLVFLKITQALSDFTNASFSSGSRRYVPCGYSPYSLI